MIKNYFLIAFRNIKRSLGYTVVNVLGLALGISCSLVLFLMINFLISYDDYHANRDRIYRVVTSSSYQGKVSYGTGVPAVFPDAFEKEISGLENVLFISGGHDNTIIIEENGEKRIFEESQGMAFTNSNYFNFFDRKIISGDRSAPLNEPNKAILSESMAKKLFGDENPIGKSFSLDMRHEMTVAAVMEDFPNNTDFPFHALFSYKTIEEEKVKQGWTSTYSDDQCYVMLSPGVSPERLKPLMKDFDIKYIGEKNAKEMSRDLQPMSDFHFSSLYTNYNFKTVSRESIWAMALIGILLIVTACINFVNLATSVAVKRSKEVGIRKVLGGQRFELIAQYLSETLMITALAILVGTGFAELGLINLNSFIGLDLHVNGNVLQTGIFLAVLWVVVGLLSGLYPAFVLSGFRPVQALKNKISSRGSGGFLLRRILVVFQFFCSQLLIICTVILISQMEYFNNKDLGFNKEAILMIALPEPQSVEKKHVLKRETERMAGVESVSLCMAPPSSGSVAVTDFTVAGIEGQFLTQVKLADAEYFSLFQLDVLAGTTYQPSDTMNGFVVNENLVKSLGLEKPEDIVGRNVKLWGKTYPVVGVVKDFHTMSLDEEVGPTIILSQINDYHEMAVKVNTHDPLSLVAEIEKAWGTQYDNFLFHYQFLDEQIEEFYQSEKKMTTLLSIFSGIAIFIGCIGLYGLVSFMASEREKEIGVRKVLGASTSQILVLFSREFVLLIFIAFIFAAPLSGYTMGKWLEKFAYRIELSAFMFIVGIGVTLLIALATVSYQAIRASLTNPVDVLKDE